MRLNHRQIEAFRAVFQTNSMTAAAALMGVTQQAISRLIRDLEAEIGLKLFDRQSRGLLATPEAVALEREVRRSFHGLDRIARAAVEIGQKRPGVLRIAASAAPSLHFLPRVISRFRAQWPGVRISLNTLPSSEVINTVALQQDDIGLADAPAGAPGVDVEALRSLAFVCALPPGHALARKRVLRPKDLRAVPLLITSGATRQHQRIMAAFETAGIVPDIVFEASNGASIRALVAEDAGVAILDPITAGARDIGSMVVRKFSPEIDYDLKLIYPANRARADRLRGFAAAVHEELGRL